MKLNQLTCTPRQAGRLVEMGINPVAFLYHFYRTTDKGSEWLTGPDFRPDIGPACVPAWTKVELDAMIGPRFAKPDLWSEDRRGHENGATDPNTYPVYSLEKCYVFRNGAQASAFGLLFLLEGGYLDAAECNERYHDIFINPKP